MAEEINVNFKDLSSGPGGRPWNPGERTDYERVMFRGEIPPPPPPPTSRMPELPSASSTGTSSHGVLREILNELKRQNVPTAQAVGPPPAPPPVIPPRPSRMQAMMGRLAGSAAFPAFSGAILGQVTGSATIGGLGGMGAGAVTQGLAALGPVGMAAAAGLAGITMVTTGVIEVFQKLTNITEGLIRDVGRYSPDVMMAQSSQEAAGIMQRVRLAGQLGPELAGFIRERGQLTRSVEDLKATIMQELIPLISESFKLLNANIVVLHGILLKWQEGTFADRIKLIAAGANILTYLGYIFDEGEDIKRLLEEKKHEDLASYQKFMEFFTEDQPARQGAGADDRHRDWANGPIIPMPMPQLGAF